MVKQVASATQRIDRAAAALRETFLRDTALANPSRDTSTQGQAYRRNSLGIAYSEDLYRVFNRLNTPGYEKTWETIASNALSEEEQKARTARMKEEETLNPKPEALSTL